VSGRLGNDVRALDPGAVEALWELLGGDRDALAELADAFLDEAPNRLAEVRLGAERGDPVLAGRAAHTLKSNALTFGANDLAAVARSIELAVHDGVPADIGELVDRLDAAWPPVRAALVALRDRSLP
jgi:HPt (histidine-containing phosphotransfer) domain-containing protein